LGRRDTYQRHGGRRRFGFHYARTHSRLVLGRHHHRFERDVPREEEELVHVDQGVAAGVLGVLHRLQESPDFALSSGRAGPTQAAGRSLEAVAWPQRLETIFFSHLAPFNQPIDQVQWPVSLQRLVFGWSFNQRIEHVSWPDSLQVLAFGFAFNQPIDLVQWPASLQELEFEVRFNQRIEDVSWPDSLEILEFGREFNQPVEGVSWPDSLRVLSFGDHFNQPIEGVVWPASLKQIIFSVDSHFDHPIENVAWPTCLEKVVFGEIFNQPIARATFPASLQELSFAGEFNQPIEGVSWPNSIRRLELGASFNKPIDNVRWPASLREIKFGWGTEGDNRMVICSEFNQRIDNCVWPLSLRWLTLGDEFRQSLKGLGTWIPNLEGFRLLDYLDYDPGGGSLLRGIEWPKGLRQLTVFEDSDLDGVEIPSTVKVSYPLNDIHYRRARAGLAV
ncbi:unnamed protein product, partial [Ectocarpus fasciculatus]